MGAMRAAILIHVGDTPSLILEWLGKDILGINNINQVTDRYVGLGW